MKTTRRVGGSLLGKKEWFLYKSDLTLAHRHRLSVPSWDTFEPLLTPSIHGEVFILLPCSRYITVLSHKTGRTLGHLVPTSRIHCVSLAKIGRLETEKPSLQQRLEQDSDVDDSSSSSSSSEEEDNQEHLLEEHVVLVGCHNGTLEEFSLSVVLEKKQNDSSTESPYNFNLVGPCHEPRRVFAATDKPLLHMTVPLIETSDPSRKGAILYVLADQGRVPDKKVKKKKKKLLKEQQQEEEKKKQQQKEEKKHEKDETEATKDYSDKKAEKEKKKKKAKKGKEEKEAKEDKEKAPEKDDSKDKEQVEEKDNTKDEKPKEESKKTNVIAAEMALLRIVLPPYDKDKKGDEVIDLTETNDAVQELDRFKCRLRGSHYNSFPFRLVSTARPSRTNQNQDVFVTVGRSTAITIYHEQMTDSLQVVKSSTSPVVFAAPNHNPVTALATCTTDLATGHAEGDIRIWHDIFTTVLRYQDALAQRAKDTSMPVPRHASHDAIVKRLHWHAHAVATLSYYGGGNFDNPYAPPQAQNNMLMLYSGGVESVLITWQPSRGIYRPADILPRMAKGGMVHICNNGRTVLICSQDNSLQLLQSHNQSLLWKRQGLPLEEEEEEEEQSNAEITMTPDPLSAEGTIVLRGMMGSPGFLHWYNASQQRVVDTLEVVPYNRVSRTEHKDHPMPPPVVLHSAFARDGKQLVTVDAVWSENRHVGAPWFFQRGRPPLGVTHTIRFWTKSSTNNQNDGPYELSAAMTNPHGRENAVSAMALSMDGQYVCTVSNDEHAFRIWHRIEIDEEEDEEEGRDKRRIMSWVCQYKITTPSGYSNLPTSRNGVAFSSDGSLLAICFGNVISLWDHNDATLVTTMRHLDDDDSPIDSIEFVKTAYLHDLLLTKSRDGVTLQSLFGQVIDTQWSYRLFYVNHEEAHVSHAELLPTNNIVAVSLYRSYYNSTQIILLDAVSGDPKTITSGKKELNLTWYLRGHVKAMGPASDNTERKSAWTDVSSNTDEPPPAEPPIQLYVLMKSGEMFLLQGDFGTGENGTLEDPVEDMEAATTPGKRRTMLSSTDAPVLDLVTSRKRFKTTISINEDVAALKCQDDVLFGSLPKQDGAPSTQLPSSDLPVLSAGFTRTFLGKKLSKSTE